MCVKRKDTLSHFRNLTEANKLFKFQVDNFEGKTITRTLQPCFICNSILHIIKSLVFRFSFNNTAGKLSRNSPKSYTILNDGNITHVLNENTKTIEYSSTDTSAVINAALEALPDYGGKICIKAGNYSLLSTIILNKPCILEGEGSGCSYPAEGITQLNFGNTTGVKITSSGVRISHLRLRGCGDTAVACYGIHLDASSNILNQNLNVEDVI